MGAYPIGKNLKEFLGKYLWQLGGSRKATYLFVSGQTANSFAGELADVADPMGISRRNVLYLAPDQISLKKMERAHTGAEILFDPRFFSESDRRFDIIQVGQSGMENLNMVVSRNMLKPKGILIANYHSERMNYGETNEDEKCTDLLKELIIPERPKFLRKLLREFMGYVNNINSRQTTPTRKPASSEVTEYIINAFYEGNKEALCSLYRANPEFQKINEEWRELNMEKLKEILSAQKRILEETFEALPSNIAAKTGNIYSKMLRYLKGFGERIKDFEAISDEELLRKIPFIAEEHEDRTLQYLVTSGIPEEVAEAVLFLYKTKDSGGYFCRDVERYVTGNAATPSFWDFYFFDQLADLFGKYGELITAGKQGGSEPPALNVKSCLELFSDPLIREIEECLPRTDGEKLKGRVVLKYPEPALPCGQYLEPLPKAKERTDYHVSERPAGKEANPRKYELKDLIRTQNPRKFISRLPKGVERRVRFFVEEDLPSRICPDPEGTERLLGDISKSEWYKGISEEQAVAFFNDIMLYSIWFGKMPAANCIETIYQNCMKDSKRLPFAPSSGV